jgi:hypothetical protein
LASKDQYQAFRLYIENELDRWKRKAAKKRLKKHYYKHIAFLEGMLEDMDSARRFRIRKQNEGENSSKIAKMMQQIQMKRIM